ncbi:hypothetical protein [Mucilaginibacter gracilis]|nr:hypothetical protein [Mucilaginibacter gracilis]
MVTTSLIVFLLQLMIDASYENILCNLMAVAIFYLTCLVVFAPRNNSLGPALTATTVFICITGNSLMPMIGTTLEGHPLIYTLLIPVDVFFHRLLFGLALLAAQLLASSRFSLPIKMGMSKIGTYAKSRVLIPPSGLWVLGFIGVSAIMINHFVGLPSILAKFIDGFNFLTVSPFLILLRPYNSIVKWKEIWLKILLYFLLQVVIAFINNSRAGFVLPIAILAAGWLMQMLMGLVFIDNKLLRRGVIAGILGLGLLGQFADLSTAIIMERGQRATRSADEQLAATLSRFTDKKSLEDFRSELGEANEGISAANVWQENYVNNPFLARFIQIKFDDNCLYRTSSFGDYQIDQLRNVTINKLYALLPDPLLKALSIKIDKKFINSFSIADFIVDLSTGQESNNSFLTASIPIHSFTLFYWLYPVVLAIVYFLVFTMIQGLFSIFGYTTMYGGISTLSLLYAYFLFVYITIDSLTMVLSFMLRNFWQDLIIYYIAIGVVRILGIANNINIPIRFKRINKTLVRAHR